MITIGIQQYFNDIKRFTEVLQKMQATSFLHIGQFVVFKEGTPLATDHDVYEIIDIEIRVHEQATEPFELHVILNGLWGSLDIDEAEMLTLRAATKGDLVPFLTDTDSVMREEAQLRYHYLDDLEKHLRSKCV